MMPAHQDLVNHMPLVHQSVARFLARVPPNVLREDLVAAGTYGLIDALRKNPVESRPETFEWYARIRIRGAILDELRSQDWLSRRTRNRLTAERGTRSTIVPLEELPPPLEADSDPTPDVLVEARREHEAMREALSALPERERKIIRLHYFEGVQFKEIARQLGVSEPRVSQLHTRAVGLLRAAMAA